MFRFLQYHLPILTLRSSNMATGNPLYTKLSIGNSSIDFRDFPAMFGSQRVNALKSVETMKVPPAHHPKDDDLNQANAWKRHRRSGAVESADLTKNREAVQMEPSNKKTGFNKAGFNKGSCQYQGT